MNAIGCLTDPQISVKDQEKSFLDRSATGLYTPAGVTRDFLEALASDAEAIVFLQAESLPLSILEVHERTKSAGKTVIFSRSGKVFKPGTLLD